MKRAVSAVREEEHITPRNSSTYHIGRLTRPSLRSIGNLPLHPPLSLSPVPPTRSCPPPPPPPPPPVPVVGKQSRFKKENRAFEVNQRRYVLY